MLSHGLLNSREEVGTREKVLSASADRPMIMGIECFMDEKYAARWKVLACLELVKEDNSVPGQLF